ncbi:alpha-1,2-mannosidase [Nocardioides gansuensis]|uniref:Alpha-1,2-mannosidase n=1 Tax=Nocardioides gansuensis TaxID=2138300 RepID=A0A2T8F7B6_9ACTN|nr:GH92 family glycosyl hydrolase [Nocardioides gansuensis]PVG81611.1 alpha-1,2-mannosidase [Nocardioides gansuensis]
MTRRRGYRSLGSAVALLAGLATATPLAVTAFTPAAGSVPAARAGATAAVTADEDLTSLVNPFIGSQNDGNTFPGAAVPFGMVQMSPDTGHNVGYRYDQDRIRGFSTVHLSGVGCGLGGTLPVLPTTGAVTETDYARYAATKDRASEVAEPGYYRVRLADSDITAELSATTRTAWQRYTFPATGRANVLLNTGQALHRVTSSEVRVLDDRTLVSEVTGRGFCQDTRPYTLYFVTRFDRPFSGHGTWQGGVVTPGSGSSAAGEARNGAYVRFDTTSDRDVEAVTALSYVDLDGAHANLAAEGGSTFDEVRTAADAAWEQRLQQVRVGGGAAVERRTFYSSLYRSFLAPTVGSDVDGRYRGWDQQVHTAEDFTYYQNWSLWDTYRTQQQLLALLAPRESRDMARSILRIEDEGGWLPRWGHATVETNIMTGDPVTPFLVSAWRQGLLDGHEEDAYAALRENADGVPPADSPYNGRSGNPTYLSEGFVPYLPDARNKPGDYDLNHGPSATLEYALADCTLSTMAGALGHTADARRYAARGRSFRNVFDPSTTWFRARDAQGRFVGPADPKDSVGFHEGTAWQYMWLAQQDMQGLVDLMGGRAEARRRLDYFFAYEQLVDDPRRVAREVWVNGPYAYYNADRYNPQNEPDLHSPYTYLWTGEPHKTSDVVHAALTLFSDGPTGMTGNDDLGTMSAWHVLSAIGIYPVMPGTDVWGLTTPIFDGVEIALDESFHGTGSLVITAPGADGGTRSYITAAELGGRAWQRTWATTEELLAGGTLALRVGDDPSGWGTSRGDAPPSLCGAGRADTSRLAAGTSPTSLAMPSSEADVTAEVILDVVATGAGEVTGTVTATAAAPVAVAPGSSTWTADSKGLPTTVSVPVDVTVPAGTPDGTYEVRLAVADERGNQVVRTLPVRVVTADCAADVGSCPQDLTGSWDHDGVATLDASAEGNFDGGGWSFPAEQLPEPGLGVLGDWAYLFPETGGNAPNFVEARGQAVPLNGGRFAALDVIASAHHGDVQATVRVTYADGTTVDVPFRVTDWAAGSPRFGETLAVRTDYRVRAGTGRDAPPVALWHLELPVDPGREPVSLTLPDDPRLEVYALSGRNG